MNNLLTVEDADFDPKIKRGAESQYHLREAARGVLFDDTGLIYLMHVKKHGYHKLPGGGLDPGESKVDALKRELLEEVGCNAEIIEETGTTTEYRNHNDFEKQISYCYIAKQIGALREPHLEQAEIDNGMTHIKVSGIQAAIDLLENDKPDNISGKFIQKRDLAILRQAQLI